MSDWAVYMLRCSDGSLYTGITTDVERRLDEHNSGNGSKYVRSRLPAKLAYTEGGHDQSSALSREAEIKSMTKSEKESLADE